MSRRLFTLSAVALAGLGLVLTFVACTAEDEPHEQVRSDVHPPLPGIPAPLPGAHCEILVEGHGLVDMENDYLPHVITCENGGANFEALKAQAIAARSVAYYYIENQGSVCDSQGCQVYTCGSEPSAEAYQAVAETSGLYAMFNNTLTYTFYVAGDNGVDPPACVGNPNVGTEGWVTYNEGQSGFNVNQTDLGWVHDPGDPGYGQNRGCMSQWGARCLENNNDYDYVDIMRFYYGDDIELVQAQGECVEELGGDGDGDPDPTTTTTTGDGDPDPTTTTWTGDGDGDETTTDDTGPCSVGSLGCVCTMGGGCDPGLICEDGYCAPEDEDPTEGTTGGMSGGDETSGGQTGLTGFGDEFGRRDDSGCNCATDLDADEGRLGGLALLALFGLLAPIRRRR